MKKTSFLLIIFLSCSVAAQEFNYDESKVPSYQLPEILVADDGKQINTVAKWEGIRRPEILRIFENQMYGKVPETTIETKFQVDEEWTIALNGRAKRKQVSIVLSGNGLADTAHLLIYVPAQADGPVPLFLGMNFMGNHTIIHDPGISITKNQAPKHSSYGIEDYFSTDLSRGSGTCRWPVERILSRGYGLATFHYEDIDPDVDDGFRNGIHPLFNSEGKTHPARDEWGSIAAWAYGLSVAMDFLEMESLIDPRKVSIIGHSRLGKAAVWAGAKDTRFALVISNNSGCGGAALSRRRYGETVQRINTKFPHWFCDAFNDYNDNEDAMPFDQHMLIALIAPRPVYIASAIEDQWADPKGEYLSGFYAGEVYKLYGLTGLGSPDPPLLNQPIQTGYIGYHIRSGVHDVTAWDWEQYLDFADKTLR